MPASPTVPGLAPAELVPFLRQVRTEDNQNVVSRNFRAWVRGKSGRRNHPRGDPVTATDTHYASGRLIRAGDRVRDDGGTGVVVFVLGTDDFATGYDPTDWAYLARRFMTDYEQAGLVFAETADDVELVSRG